MVTDGRLKMNYNPLAPFIMGEFGVNTTPFENLS